MHPPPTPPIEGRGALKSPLPWWERARERGKGTITILVAGTKTIHLADHAACQPRPAATEGSGMVGMVVTPHMDHERAPLQVGKL